MYAAVTIIPVTSSLSQTRPIFHGVRYYIAYSTVTLAAHVHRELINPRRACAARVAVLGLSVCVSVRP